MKTKISKWLIGLAEKLNPQERLSSIERVDNYEAKKLGIRFYSHQERNKGLPEKDET